MRWDRSRRQRQAILDPDSNGHGPRASSLRPCYFPMDRGSGERAGSGVDRGSRSIASLVPLTSLPHVPTVLRSRTFPRLEDGMDKPSTMGNIHSGSQPTHQRLERRLTTKLTSRSPPHPLPWIELKSRVNPIGSLSHPPHPLFGGRCPGSSRGVSAEGGCICSVGAMACAMVAMAISISLLRTHTRPGRAPSDPMDPQEEQDMEIEALQAIYLPHEFGPAEGNPWKAPTETSTDDGTVACGDAWTVRARGREERKERRGTTWRWC